MWKHCFSNPFKPLFPFFSVLFTNLETKHLFTLVSYSKEWETTRVRKKSQIFSDRVRKISHISELSTNFCADQSRQLAMLWNTGVKLQYTLQNPQSDPYPSWSDSALLAQHYIKTLLSPSRAHLRQSHQRLPYNALLCFRFCKGFLCASLITSLQLCILPLTTYEILNKLPTKYF